MTQESPDSFPKARVKKEVLKHAEMNRASKEPMASTDKEKHIASTFCLLFRGFQGHQKKGTSEFIEEKKNSINTQLIQEDC